MAGSRYKLTKRRREIAIRFVRRYPALCTRRMALQENEEAILCAVEKALEKIDAQYRSQVLDSILFSISRYEMEKRRYASESTWQRQREKFLYYVALFAKVR